MSRPVESSYVCPVCEKQFDTPQQRGGHLGAVHSNTEKRESLLERLIQFIEEKGTVPTSDELDDCDWGSEHTFSSVFGSWQAAVEALGYDPVWKRVTNQELLDELQELEDQLGRTPRKKDMVEQGQFGTSVYRRHFGGWNAALKKTGMEPNRRLRISDEELLSELEEVASQLDCSPTKKEFDEHGEFCAGTYVNRFGSWNAALNAVDCRPNRGADFSSEELIQELQEIADDLDKPPSANDAKGLSEYGLSAYECEFGSWTNALEAAGTGTNQPDSVPEERLLSSLQELATEIGESPTVVENRQLGEYSFGAYQNTFGSWNASLRAAGLELNSEHNIPHEDLLAEVTRLAEELGKPPTTEEMDAYGRYSTNPYNSAFDTWSSCLEEAGFSPWRARRHETHPIYGVGWNEEIREKVRDRDGRECIACGLSETVHMDDFDRRLDVHHICGARTSSNPAVFNAPRNLITLCMSCHVDAEPYTPGLPPYLEQPATRTEE